ncbi:hypothetical protein [Rhizobium rhizogenes]|uniref:hypothetical protein n=1 Tax=Rhizobium rhizogenes TaxID=359 RepID=UPI001573234B|nr:hypothetical protein [Rhizobium rhizogenes]NTG94218.1 hypothetical protein [Rhizobium rhizogenes]
MSEQPRPKLRDCPFCHADGTDDERVHFMGNLMIYNGGEYVASYSIFCTGCAVQLHDEYRDEVIRLWNGEPKVEEVE